MERALWTAIAGCCWMFASSSGLDTVVLDFARAADDLQLTDADMKSFSPIYERLVALRMHKSLQNATGRAYHSCHNIDEHAIAHDLELALEQLRIARFTLTLVCDHVTKCIG